MTVGREIESEPQGSFLLKKQSPNGFLVRGSVLKSDVSPAGTLHNEAARSNPPSDVRTLRRMARLRLLFESFK